MMKFVKKGKELHEVAQRYLKLKQQLPRKIGLAAADLFKENFRAQGFIRGDGQLDKWPARKEGAGKRGVLMQTGRLRRSIKIAGMMEDYVRVATDVPYAQAHNEGGTHTVPLTPRMRKFFWAMWYKTKEPRWKAMALTKQKTLTIKLPKRQFMGNSKALDKRLQRLIIRELQQVLK